MSKVVVTFRFFFIYMKEFSKVTSVFVDFLPPHTNFFKKRSSGMKFFLESNLPGNPILAEKKPQYVPPNGRYVAGNIGHQRILAKMGPKFTQNFQHLLN